MIKSDEIIDFIKRRFPNSDHWLDGNCYWFARILCERFSVLEMYYDPIEGHFYAGNGFIFYDWNGAHMKRFKDNRIKFSLLQKEDPLWYERIIRDCKM